MNQQQPPTSWSEETERDENDRIATDACSSRSQSTQSAQTETVVVSGEEESDSLSLPAGALSLEKLKAVQREVHSGKNITQHGIVMCLIDSLVGFAEREMEKNEMLLTRVARLEEELDKMKGNEKKIEVEKCEKELLVKRVPAAVSLDDFRKNLAKDLGLPSAPPAVRLKSSPQQEELMKKRNKANAPPLKIFFATKEQKFQLLNSLKKVANGAPSRAFSYEPSIPGFLRDDARELQYKAFLMRSEKKGTRTLLKVDKNELAVYLAVKRPGETKFNRI